MTEQLRSALSYLHTHIRRILAITVALAIFSIPVATHAATYYVDSVAGNDANAGTSTTAPWKTLVPVNAKAYVAGDSILFKAGGVYPGTFTLKKSGTTTAPITIGAYGTGAKPKLTGFTTVTGWTSLGGGIWKASLPNASSANPLNLVTLNGEPQEVGRYPNANPTDGGFLTYESFTNSASGVSPTLTDTTVPSVNWTGAEMVVRKNAWSYDQGPITAQSAGTYTYTCTSCAESYNKNFGYFIQRDPRTLDQLGEWYFNPATKELQMYFGSSGPSSYTVQAATLDTVIDLGSQKYIVIDGVAVEGANLQGVRIVDGNTLTVKNSSFDLFGQYAMYLWNTPSLTIDSNNITRVYGNGIFIRNYDNSPAGQSVYGNIFITNNTINEIGTIPGMGYAGPSSSNGIHVSASGPGVKNVRIANNNISTVGYNGIQWQGTDVVVEKNIITDFCTIKHDGAGIYTYMSNRANGLSNFTNRVIRNNIITNGSGTGQLGTPERTRVNGIYNDGDTMNVDIKDNTIINIIQDGIRANNALNENFSGNNIWLNENSWQSKGQQAGIRFVEWQDRDVSNLNIIDNVIHLSSVQDFIHYVNVNLPDSSLATYQSQLRSTGLIDRNYYNLETSEAGFSPELYTYINGVTTAVAGAPSMSLDGWKEFGLKDANSKSTPKVPLYSISSVGPNLFSNGSFTTNTAGISGPNTWDGNAILDGGSMKVDATAQKNGNIIEAGAIGSVSSAKKYVLRFSTKGTTNAGTFKVYLRQSASPWTQLTPYQYGSFSTTRKEHEFIFDAPTTNSAASFTITVNDFSGVTYIDNIYFAEITATKLNPLDYNRIEYNDTVSTKTVALPGAWVDARGTVYNGSVTLAPFTSVILFKTSAPTVAMTSPANAATIGGLATVSASANDTGGIAKVDFYLGTTLLYSDTTLPYSFVWNTTTLANGPYTLTAKATNTAGVTTTSAPITVTVGNADTTPPTVSLTSPAAGSISGTTTVTANASDNVGVTKVDFYQDTTLIASDTSAPYSASWDTTTVSNGVYSLKAIAYDAAGNSTTSAVVSVTVSNADKAAPTVMLTVPAAGATLSLSALLAATATDNIGVSRIDFYQGTILIGTDSVAPYSINWDTTGLINGSYTLKAIAYDAAGNAGTSSLVSVSVTNADTTPPTVSLTSPAAGPIMGLVNLVATATDNIGVTKVDFYAGNTFMGSDTSAPYSVSWDTTKSPNSTFPVKAIAYDAAGNSTTSVVVSLTVNNPDVTPPVVSLTAPSVGSVLNGTVALTANATDNIGVSRIDFYQGTTLIGTDTSAPYSVSWNTTTVGNGSYSLKAVAYDAAGNTTSSSLVAVTINNPDITSPTSILTAPLLGATLRGVVSVAATATDNIGVSRVDFYQGTTLIGTDSVAPYSINWDTANAVNGSYTLKAIAYDAAGNSTTSVVISLTVNNPDVTAPVVAITSPVAGAVLSGTATITASASDAVGVARVDIFVGSTRVASDTTAPYTATWDTTQSTNSTFGLSATAYDIAGNSTTTPLTIVTVNNADTTAPTIALTYPTVTGTISSTVVLAATASDNRGIARVEFYAGKTLIGTSTSAPYTATWDTTKSPNDTFPVKAIAYDTSGNSASTGAISLTVNNVTSGVSVYLASPVQGTTVSGTIAVTATTIGAGITRVDFFKDADATPFASTASSYTTFFDTKTLTNGQHTFRAVAYNTLGASAASTVVTVTVSNAVSGGGGGSGGSSGGGSSATTLPSAPLSAIAQTGIGRAMVTWDAPLSTGGSAITSYTVTDGAGITQTVAASPALITGLTTGATYVFTVRANTSAGAGEAAQTNPAGSVTAFPIGKTVEVQVSSSLNVRKIAGGAVSGSVTDGAKGTVLANSGAWTQVQFPTITGWVANAYLYAVYAPR